MADDTNQQQNIQGQGYVNPVQVQKFLKNVDYPASKQELISVAKSEGADDNVIATLERLPDQEYATPVDVNEAIGELE